MENTVIATVTADVTLADLLQQRVVVVDAEDDPPTVTVMNALVKALVDRVLENEPRLTRLIRDKILAEVRIAVRGAVTTALSDRAQLGDSLQSAIIREACNHGIDKPNA